MPSTVIETRDLIRDFSRTRALDGLELTVGTGNVFGLLGNNGAGKTTTIHILLGLLCPTAGTARVLGRDPSAERIELTRRIGFFPETDRPYDWITLGELFRLGELTYPSWDTALCRELAEQFELETSKPVSAMSKGMVAKTKLILALGHRPECLILDEPTSGLDPGSRHDLLRLIAGVAESRGTTTLFSSHNLDDVERIATHVGIIDAGRMRLTASREAITRMGVVCAPEAGGEPLAARTDDDGTVEWLVADRTSPQFVDARPVDLPDLFLFVTDRRTRTHA